MNTNVPDLPRRLPKAFYDVTPEDVDGDSFRYNLFTHARTVATMGEWYGPSREVQLRPFGSRDMKLFSSFENIKFDGWTLEQVERAGKWLQGLERGEIDDILKGSGV